MTDAPAPPTPTTSHRWHRLALAATVLLVLGVLASLPLAVRSMQQVLGRSSDPLFDLATANEVAREDAAAADEDGTYFNLGMVDLDESTGQLTMAISGNRACAPTCPALELTFVALDDDADQRRGLPPSATISLAADAYVFSQAVQLPLRGQPSLYPFDTYRLWLGVAGVATEPDGSRVELTPEALAGQATVTLQNRVPDMIMKAPVPISAGTMRAETDPFHFLTVQGLTFVRPAYLQVLAVALVLLIAVSATLALFTRSVDELALGFGGIILGVWGVRSVLMPQTVGTVTAIDLALSWLILLLLLGLAVRAMLHFLGHSDLPVSSVLGRRSKS